jgi:hypothetical protein
VGKTEETVTKLGISAAAMITSAYVGSLIGDKATLIGTGIGAVVGGGATEIYQAILDRGKHHFKSINRRHKQYMAAGLTALACAAIGYGGLTLVEAAANRPLHAITTGSHETGTSIGGTSSAPTSQPEDVRSSSASPSSSSFSPSPSATSSATSISPTPTTIPSTVVPSTHPAVVPSTSATPIPTTPAPVSTTPVPTTTGGQSAPRTTSSSG